MTEAIIVIMISNFLTFDWGCGCGSSSLGDWIHGTPSLICGSSLRGEQLVT